MNDKHQIHLADSYEHIKTIPDGSVDLILTDPPYNCQNDKGYEWILEAYRSSAHLIKEALDSIKKTYLG